MCFDLCLNESKKQNKTKNNNNSLLLNKEGRVVQATADKNRPIHVSTLRHRLLI